MKRELKLVRVYELTSETVGRRILVDRLWPRGLRKESLEPFFWAKDAAPSTALRKWYDHVSERFPAFRERYLAELDQNAAAAALRREIDALLTEQDVLLLYAAKDAEHNHALVLREWLLRDNS